MTFRGDSGDSAERSPAAMRAANSGLPVPPPLPAQSGKHGVPSGLTPPKPYGETGSISVSEAAARSCAYRAIALVEPAGREVAVHQHHRHPVVGPRLVHVHAQPVGIDRPGADARG
ncbi:MAG TPA: hypothetical protein VFM37_08975 [Pseudonocardiaceae bacterium]|nr:hypothetical protein [Pseudonocardiaceae bacterium]